MAHLLLGDFAMTSPTRPASSEGHLHLFRYLHLAKVRCACGVEGNIESLVVPTEAPGHQQACHMYQHELHRKAACLTAEHHCTCHPLPPSVAPQHPSKVNTTDNPHGNSLAPTSVGLEAGMLSSDKCQFCGGFYEKAVPFVCHDCWSFVQRYMKEAFQEGERAGLRRGVEEAYDTFREIVQKWHDAYPDDIFPDPKGEAVVMALHMSKRLLEQIEEARQEAEGHG